MIIRRLLIVAVASTTLAACHGSGSNPEAFRWTEPLPPGAVVHLLNGSGSISVRPGTGNAVVVNGSTRWRRGSASDVRFVVNHRGNDYFVCAMWRASGRCDDRGYRGARTKSFLTMFSLLHRSSDAQAMFVAELPAGVAVEAQATNGAVDVNGVTAGVRAQAVNGNVRATSVSGPIALRAMNGDVHVSADSLSPSDGILIDATNGGIFADLPASLQGAFDLRATNGSLRSDFAIAGDDVT
ncbi:MAG TPA: DUF4097 family beta strand repeat-containing protein, partial [Gemmatimonadaceae bacterium]|nr:DUF4097 family beta strand repeat-containing protein [Gemmatimonadaceae bacterium]